MLELRYNLNIYGIYLCNSSDSGYMYNTLPFTNTFLTLVCVRSLLMERFFPIAI